MDMSERQSDLLLAAFAVAPRDGVTFDWRLVGTTCGYDRDESEDLSLILEKAGLLAMDGEMATLTPEGREEARRVKRRTVTLSLSDAEQQFLLHAALRAGAECDYYMESIATMVGLSGSDWEDLRAKLIDNGVLAPGSTFGHEYLTRTGLKAAEQLDRALNKRDAETAEGLGE